MTTTPPDSSSRAAAAKAGAAFDSTPPDENAVEATEHPHAPPPLRVTNIDITNDYGVQAGTADGTVLANVSNNILDRQAALRLAAWLVACADLGRGGHRTFRDMLEAVDDLIEPSTPPQN